MQKDVLVPFCSTTVECFVPFLHFNIHTNYGIEKWISPRIAGKVCQLSREGQNLDLGRNGHLKECIELAMLDELHQPSWRTDCGVKVRHRIIRIDILSCDLEHASTHFCQ